MKSARVLFLVSRTHGLRAHLLESQSMVRLLGSRGLKEMADLLLAGDYSAELSLVAAGDLTSVKLERAFYDKLSSRWFFLLGITSGRLEQMLEAYVELLEITNLKRIIRAIHGKDKISDDQLIRIPRKYQRVNVPALFSADSASELVDLLRETPYGGLEGMLEDYGRYNNPALFETFLDKLYYDDLWGKLKRLPDSRDIRMMIGTEVDLRNLELIVSSKFMKIDDRLVREGIISCGYRLNKTAVRRMIRADLDEIQAVSMPIPYSELVREAVELVNQDKIVEMQHVFSQYLYSFAEKVSVRKPNDLAYVLSYLQLCFKEARNLTTLAVGKQLEMSEQKLGSLVFL